MGGQTTQTGFMMRKYFDETFSGDLNSYGGNVPVIRYAEVLLSYLEAKLEAGEGITQALLDETINKVRGRASVQMPAITEVNAGSYVLFYGTSAVSNWRWKESVIGTYCVGVLHMKY